MPQPPVNIEVPAGPIPRQELLTAAVGPLPLPRHAETAGGVWESANCYRDRLYPVACQDSAYPATAYDAREALRTAYAFNVYASEVCTPVGTSLQEAADRVRQRLLLGEQTAVERGLWGGSTSTGTVVGVFEQMQAAGSLVTTLTAATSLVAGVAALEQTAVGLYDGPLYLHARPMMSAFMANRGLLDASPRARGPLNQTQFGSTVIFGGGYSGNSPTGTVPDATTETIYATGRVFVWASPDIRITDAPMMLNLTTNQRSVSAVRTYMIGVECFAAAVTVTRAG